jgi:mono/diheme cytochrome c family protein
MQRSARPIVIAAILVAPFLAAAPNSAQAQSPGLQSPGLQSPGLTDQQKLGERLLNQSCVVCHLQQQINTKSYAPTLSMITLGGKADVMSEVISNGSPHMPGFKTQFTPAQIDAIVAYIKTIPAPIAAAKPAKGGGPGEPD